MRRTDIAQRPGSISPLASTSARVLLALAAALVTVASLTASYRVGSLYSPATFLLAPATHPSVLEPIGEGGVHATGGHLVP